MRMLTFANRNAKEIIRDPLTLFFGIGFPHTVEIMLTVTEEYEHRCILVASEYFSDSV
jgi:ABC-2 type transport system permease protein